MILPRLLTAIIGIPVILLSIYFGNIPYFILVLLVVCFSLQEYFFLLVKGGYGPRVVPGYVAAGALLFSVYFSGTGVLAPAGNVVTAVVLTLFLFALFIYEILASTFKRKLEEGAVGRISTTFAGVFLISWCFGHLLLMRDIKPYGAEYTFFLFLLLWVADTAAYVTGIRFGRRRLSEKISPKKSVEGAIGGVLVGVISGILLKHLLKLGEIKTVESAVLSFVIIVVAYFSDLSESLIKRDAGVKDSDVLLPGHGGILDRFDSFLFTAPILYYYLLIFHR